MSRISPLHPEDAPPETRAAYEQHTRDHHARITNMKATLGHSLPAFRVYMEWYTLYDRIRVFLGDRLAYLYAYSISVGSNCPLCTTFFRKIIIDNGERPEALELTAEEQLLLDFGSAISQHQGRVPDTLFQQVSGQYDTQQLVDLIAFAGQMVATNVFSNTIDTDIDEYLSEYLPYNAKK